MFIKSYLSGDVYGDLKVIKKIPTDDTKHGYYLMLCSCGKKISVRSDNINSKKDCGCKKTNRLVGNRYGDGVVTKFASEKINGSKWELICDCGNNYLASKRLLENGTIKSCGCKNNNRSLDESIIGQKIGKLTALKFSSNCGSKKVLCECECGNKIEITSKRLRYSNSCGCLLKRSGKSHPNYRGYEGLSLIMFGKYKNAAKKRGLNFELTIEFLWDLLIKQNKNCAITGMPIFLSEAKNGNSTASLDRIDSSKHYTKDNVQWVHKDINQMKSNHDKDYFIFLCEKVIENKDK